MSVSSVCTVVFVQTMQPDGILPLQVAASYVNLAGLLKSENRLAEALPYFNKALDIRERAYGPDHPDVSAAQISLAELLKDLGK